MYKGKELLKVALGSELAIKIETGGYKIRRFYRNVKQFIFLIGDFP